MGTTQFTTMHHQSSRLRVSLSIIGGSMASGEQPSSLFVVYVQVFVGIENESKGDSLGGGSVVVDIDPAYQSENQCSDAHNPHPRQY